MLQAMDVGFKASAANRYGALKAARMAYEDAVLKDLPKNRSRIENTPQAIAKRMEEYMGSIPGTEPHPAVLQAMTENAKRLKYTTEMGPGLQTVARLRDVEVELPIIGKVRPLVGALPFLSTPYNVILQAFKRSPLNIINMKKLKSDYDSGRITPQQYYKEVAQTTLGTTVAAGLLVLAKEGIVTGGGPANQQDRMNKLATGWRPYSIKVPGYGYFQMQRIEPFGTILGLAGDVAEFGDSEDKIGKLLSTVKDNLTNKSFLYGLESLAQAWANPQQFGETYYKQMTGSVVPTLLAKAQQAVDPYSRVTEGTGAALGIPDAMAYRIPGLSQALPMQTTPLGEPRERWGTFGTDTTAGRVLSGVQSFAVPVPFSSERKDTDVEREFDRLSKYKGMPPSTPRREKMPTGLRGVNGENIKLTESEYRIYDKYHAIAKQQLNNIIQSPAYQRLPDDRKAELLRSIYDKFRRAANNEINVSIRRRSTVGE